MNNYRKMIVEATGCIQADAPVIEDIMRNDILHSTLGWLTRPEFDIVAREAANLLPQFRAAGILLCNPTGAMT